MDGTPGREVLGEQAPLAAGAHQVKDTVQHGAPVGGRPARGLRLGQERFDEGELFIRQIGVINLIHPYMIAENRSFRTGSESDRCVNLKLTWKTTGKQHQGRVSRWLADVLPKVSSILQKAKWEKITPDRGQYELTVQASFPTERVARQVDAAVKGLNQSVKVLSTID